MLTAKTSVLIVGAILLLLTQSKAPIALIQHKTQEKGLFFIIFLVTNTTDNIV